MDSIGTIASIIAAITGIVAMVTGIISIRNSKGNVIKRIEQKQLLIHDLEQQFYRTHGLNDDIKRYPDFQRKIDTFENEIDELRKRI